MKTGMGLALIGIGAILAFAVTTNTSVFNLHTAGYVIMIIGILGLAIPRRRLRLGRPAAVRPAGPLAARPPGRRGRLPDLRQPQSGQHPRAGRPARPGRGRQPRGGHPPRRQRDLSTEPLGPRPGETEIVEDVYED